MTRIERIGDATLYLGDCRDVLPTLGKVDAVVTDPPYLNLTGGARLEWAGGVGARKQRSVTLGDEWEATLEWAPLAQAIAAKGLMVFCATKSVCETRQALPEARALALVSWYKRNSPAAMKGVPRHTAEFVWVLATGGGLDWHKIDNTVIDIPNLSAGCVSTGERITDARGAAVHPSQKPTALMEWLLGVGPRSVADPFMGTGTTGVACAKRGIAFIGIEREPTYFDIACRRIEEAYRQPRLFDEPPPKPQQPTMFGDAA